MLRQLEVAYRFKATPDYTVRPCLMTMAKPNERTWFLPGYTPLLTLISGLIIFIRRRSLHFLGVSIPLSRN